jgi:hypothetical protein
MDFQSYSAQRAAKPRRLHVFLKEIISTFFLKKRKQVVMIERHRCPGLKNQRGREKGKNV